MTAKNHYYDSLKTRETEVVGSGKENKYSKLAEGGLLGFVIFIVSCGLIALSTSNIGVFLFFGYAVGGIIGVAIACLPLLGVIFAVSKIMAKEQVYGRQPETEGY